MDTNAGFKDAVRGSTRFCVMSEPAEVQEPPQQKTSKRNFSQEGQSKHKNGIGSVEKNTEPIQQTPPVSQRPLQENTPFSTSNGNNKSHPHALADKTAKGGGNYLNIIKNPIPIDDR